jgi:hypothetical protein
MTDEQIGEFELLLQILKEIDDLALYTHIEGRDRFIRHAP